MRILFLNVPREQVTEEACLFGTIRKIPASRSIDFVVFNDNDGVYGFTDDFGITKNKLSILSAFKDSEVVGKTSAYSFRNVVGSIVCWDNFKELILSLDVDVVGSFSVSELDDHEYLAEELIKWQS